VAWHFTKVREIDEGRNIPKESFVEQYFGSMETINALKQEYGDKIQVDLVQLSVPKPDSHQLTDYRFDFNIASIDGYVKVKYSKKQLLELL
jgi:UDP-N-acetylglucosamine kinase